MKYAAKTYLSIFIIFFCLSCDKVPLENIQSRPLQIMDCAEGKIITNSSDSSVALRKIYLEYFTGHLCGNCPGSSGPAFEQIEKTYASRVVLTKIHSGFFARTNKTYPTNFTSPSGDKIFTDNNVTAVPSGMIDRVAFKGTKLTSPSEWINAISSRTEIAPIVKLILNSGYCPDSRSLVVKSKIEFLQPYTQPVSVVGYISENNIVGMQLDYEQDPKDVPDFVHKYVLREELSVTKPFSYLTPYAKGSIVIGSLGTNLKSDWNESQCYITVLVTDEKTGEVLQVEKIKISK